MQEISLFDKLQVLKSSMAIVFSSSSLKIAKQGIFSAKFEVLSTYMKLCMNLNLRAEKQNYYRTSPNHVLIIYFPFPLLNRKTQKNKFFISCVYYLLSQRFLYLMTVKLSKVRNNLLEEMNPEWDCIVSKKHVLSTNIHENRKEE